MSEIFNYAAFQAVRPYLDRILATLPGAVVAGGYLRDTLLGRPIKDMDILTEGHVTQEQLSALEAALADGGEPGDGSLFYEYTFGEHGDALNDDDKQMAPEYSQDAGRLSHIVRLLKSDDLNADVIQTNNLAAHLEEFPDGTSKVYYGSEGLILTPAFVSDHTNKTITYRTAAGTPRLERLKAKYPGYTVVPV